MNNNSNNSSGMSCTGFFVVLLGVAFIIMKIVGVIEWSWVWVLAPIWIYAALVLFILVIGLIIAFWERK
jgi:hypothetical protein